MHVSPTRPRPTTKWGTDWTKTTTKWGTELKNLTKSGTSAPASKSSTATIAPAMKKAVRKDNTKENAKPLLIGRAFPTGDSGVKHILVHPRTHTVTTIVEGKNGKKTISTTTTTKTSSSSAVLGNATAAAYRVHGSPATTCGSPADDSP